MSTKNRRPVINAKTLRFLRQAIDIASEDFDQAFNAPLSSDQLAKQTIEKRGLSGRVQYNRIRRDIEAAQQWVTEMGRWYWTKVERAALKKAEKGGGA